MRLGLGLVLGLVPEGAIARPELDVVAGAGVPSQEVTAEALSLGLRGGWVALSGDAGSLRVSLRSNLGRGSYASSYDHSRHTEWDLGLFVGGYWAPTRIVGPFVELGGASYHLREVGFSEWSGPIDRSLWLPAGRATVGMEVQLPFLQGARLRLELVDLVFVFEPGDLFARVRFHAGFGYRF